MITKNLYKSLWNSLIFENQTHWVDFLFQNLAGLFSYGIESLITCVFIKFAITVLKKQYTKIYQSWKMSSIKSLSGCMVVAFHITATTGWLLYEIATSMSLTFNILLFTNFVVYFLNKNYLCNLEIHVNKAFKSNQNNFKN